MTRTFSWVAVATAAIAIALGAHGCGSDTGLGVTDGGGDGSPDPGAGGSGGGALGGTGGGGAGGAGGAASDGSPGGNTCRGGVACATDCVEACGVGNQGTQRCICQGGVLYCGNCQAPDGGFAVPQCPANPEGQACMGNMLCSLGQGFCVCDMRRWACLMVPDGGVPACPAGVQNNGACMMNGAICAFARDGGQGGCFCRPDSGGNLTWRCLAR